MEIDFYNLQQLVKWQFMLDFGNDVDCMGLYHQQMTKAKEVYMEIYPIVEPVAPSINFKMANVDQNQMVEMNA